MRAFERLYSNLKSSFNMEGSKRDLVFLSGESLSNKDYGRLQYAFRLWYAYGFDCLSPLLTEDEIMSRFTWIWRLLVAGYPCDQFFSDLKLWVKRCRHSDFSSSGEIMDDAISSLVEPLVPRADCPSEYAKIHGILGFLGKMYLENRSLEDEGLRAWYANEARLHDLPNPVASDLGFEIQSLICDWLNTWTPDDLDDGYFTSGSTADCGKDLYAKIHHSAITPDAGYLLAKWRPDLLMKGPALVVPGYTFYSKWIQVPKSSTALREISEETAALNYWQVSIDNSLRKVFKRSPLGSIITQDDQSRNRELAIIGSCNGKYATLDQSKASDSVRFDHLQLFPWPLRGWLYAFRSPITLIDGDLFFIEKFAAMGSRLTFDVMQIIFAAIGWIAESRAGIPEKDRKLSIVGDDIVIETEAAEECMRILREMGFIPNEDKSYISGDFRESCGVFAYKGVDITEPALPRRPLPIGWGTENSADCWWLASFADNSWLHNRNFLRYVCTQLIMQHGNPWFRDLTQNDAYRVLEGTSSAEWEMRGSYSMYSPAPTNWRLRTRSPSGSKPDYGKGQARLLLSDIRTCHPYDDDQLYEIWLYLNRNRRLDSEPCPESLRGLGWGQKQLPPREGWVTIPG